MTAQTTPQQRISGGVRVAPIIVTAIAVLAFLTGLALATLVGVAADTTSTIAAPAAPAAHAVQAPVSAPFDAPRFRADERSSAIAAPSVVTTQFGVDRRERSDMRG